MILFETKVSLSKLTGQVTVEIESTTNTNTVIELGLNVHKDTLYFFKITVRTSSEYGVAKIWQKTELKAKKEGFEVF